MSARSAAPPNTASTVLSEGLPLGKLSLSDGGGDAFPDLEFVVISCPLLVAFFSLTFPIYSTLPKDSGSA